MIGTTTPHTEQGSVNYVSLCRLKDDTVQIEIKVTTETGTAFFHMENTKDNALSLFDEFKADSFSFMTDRHVTVYWSLPCGSPVLCGFEVKWDFPGM